MSNSIDQRIVEMQFDNSQFEKGVATTLQSLKSLENGLTLKDGVSGLDNVQKSVDKISFKGIEGETGRLSETLSGLKDTALNVFDHIANGVGTVVKGFTIAKGIMSAGIAGLAIQGGWNRASNINKASFKLDAMGVGWENVQLQVQKSVDGTAYSLDAAASAAAMFASSGVEVNKTLAETTVEGDQMQQSLKAVANLASVSGSSFEQMSDIFAKVAAQGKLSGMQVQSLAFASVDAAGIFRRQLGWSAEEFAEAQRKGLIDFQTFVDVVNKEYGDAAGLANKSFDGALANMRSALSRTTADLFQYGQLGMIPVFNGIRESINMFNNALNPLMRTWTEFDKATGKSELRKGTLIKGFEDLTKEVGRAFHDFGGKWDPEMDNVSKGSKRVGAYIEMTYVRYNRLFKMIADGLEGPISEFNAGVYDLAHGLLDMGSIFREFVRLGLEALSPIGMAFQDIFGQGSFAKATKGFKDGVWTILETFANLKIADGYINTLRASFQVLFTIVRGIGSVAFKVLGSAIKSFFSILASFGTFMGGVFNALDSLRTSGSNIGKSIGNALSPIVDFFKNIPVLGSVIDMFSKIPEGIGKFIDAVKGGEGSFDALSGFLSGVESNFSSIGDDIAGFFLSVSDGVASFATSFKDKAAEKVTVFMERVDGVWRKVSPGLKDMRDNIGEIFASIGDAISQAFPDSNPIETILGNIGNVMGGAFETVKSAASGIADFLKQAFADSELNAEPFLEFFGSIKDSLVEFFSGEEGKFDFGALISSIGKAASSLVEDVAPKFSTFVEKVTSPIRDSLLPILDQVEKKIENIGGPFERLGETISKTGDLIADFSLEKLFSFGKVDSGSGVDGSGLAKMGNDTYEAVSNLESIMDTVSHPVKSIKKTIGDTFGGLGDFIHDAIGKISEGDIKQFISILASMGISAGVVVGLLNMTKAVRAVSETASAIGGFVKSISGVFKGITDTLSTIKTSIKIHMFLELAIAVAIIAASIIALTMIPNKDKLGEAVAIVAAVMGALAGISLLFGFLSANKKNFNFRGVTFITASIMQLALAIAAVVGVLALAAILQQYGDLSAGLVPVFGVLTVFVLLSALMSKIKVANIATAGATMMAIAQSLLVIFVAIELFAHIPDQDLEKAMPIIMKLMILMGLIAGMIGFLTGLSKGSSMMSGMAGTFLGIAATMIVLAGVVKVLGGMDKGELDKGIGAIIAITVMVGLLAALIAGLSTLGGGTGANIAAPLLAMSAAIVALGLAIGGLAIVSNMVGSGNMGMALVALSVGLLALGGAMALMSLAAPQMLTVAAAMMVLVVAVGALSLFAMAMSTYGEQILAGVKAIAPALLLFVGALLAVGIIGKFFADGIFGIAAAFALLGVGLIAIAAALLIGVSAMAMFASVSGQFVPAFQQFGQAMIDIFSQGNLAIEMFGVSVMMGILGAACLILGVGLGVLTVALWGFGKVLPDAAATIGTALTNMANFISQNKDAIANAVRSMIDVAGKVITECAMNLFNEAKQIPNKISEGIKNNPDAVSNGVRDVVHSIGTAFAETLPVVGNIIWTILTEIATSLFEGIAKAVTGPVEWLDHKLFELTNGLMGHSGAAQAATDAVGTAAVNGLTTSTQNMTEPVKAQIDKMIGDVQAKAPEAAAASGEMGAGIVNSISNPLEAFGGSGSILEKMGLTPEVIAGGVDTIKGVFAEHGMEIPDDFAQSIANGASPDQIIQGLMGQGFDFTQFDSSLEAGAIQGGETFKLTFGNEMNAEDISALVANAANIDVDTLGEKMSEAGHVAAESFTSSFGDSIKIDGEGPIEKVASALKASGSKLESTGRSMGKSVDTGFKAGAKNMKAEGAKAADSAIASARSKASSANSAGRYVGHQLGAGLASGINSTIGSVASAVAHLEALAERALRARAKVHSPSRVWMELGRYLGEGLAIGIASTKPIVNEASESLMDSAMAEALEQAGYLSGLLDDIDDQPTIRPVLDLTDYEAGIARMQGLNASAPMNSAQWANRLYGTGDAGGNLTNNNTPITINLNYEAGDDANAMVRDICRGLQVKSLMEA